MRILSPEMLSIICDVKANSNMESVCIGVDIYGEVLGFQKPHRLAQYVPQLGHESARFRYDREVWGPTAAQKRYDTRTDLGNTAAVDGDGFILRGRGPIQITGGYNYRAFTAWAKEKFPHLNPPDFFENPDSVNIDPWEGLGPLWYWERTSLNQYADAGNNEMVTRRINGGLNGYADRLALYDRTSLFFLGYDPDEGVKPFQRATPGLDVDGISGPKTRMALHHALVALPPVSVADTPTPTGRSEADDLLAAIADSINEYLKSKES